MSNTDNKVFKGTPGPWKKEVRGGSIVAVIPKFFGQRDVSTVLKVGYITDDDCGVETCCKVEEHSNARLIAAAPELLEALQVLLAAYQSDGTEDFYNLDPVELAKSAINKALGTI